MALDQAGGAGNALRVFAAVEALLNGGSVWSPRAAKPSTPALACCGH
jgi:hypothetical protein